MKHKKGTSANILTLGVVSLLAVGSWVIFDVYRALTNTTVPKVLQKQIEPLPVDISAELIGELRSRRAFDILELNAVKPITVGVIEEATPEAEILINEPLPTPDVATESGIEESEVASESAR